MNSLIEGGLIGLGIAIILYGLEYFLLKKQAGERAVRQHRTGAEFDATELARLHSVGRMCLVVPFFFAAMYWLIF